MLELGILNLNHSQGKCVCVQDLVYEYVHNLHRSCAHEDQYISAAFAHLAIAFFFFFSQETCIGQTTVSIS